MGSKLPRVQTGISQFENVGIEFFEWDFLVLMGIFGLVRPVLAKKEYKFRDSIENKRTITPSMPKTLILGMT